MHYTSENIISNICDYNLYDIIGCKVYFGDTPEEVLKFANTHDYDHWGTFLGKIDGMFDIKEDNSGWEYLIVCQTQDFEGDYIPFESKYEFIDKYYRILEKNKDINENIPDDLKLMRCGMFIQEKYSPAVYQVLEIDDLCIKISKRDSIVTWHNLLEHFEFLDGSKCGKLFERVEDCNGN